MKHILKIAIFLAILAACLFYYSDRPLFAVDIFDLSYTLTEGGYRLELDEANAYKGLQLSVTSNVSTRYEIFQRINRPLENKDLPGVTLRDNFVVRVLLGTNKFGTLHFSSTDTPVRSDDRIYTSDTVGDADTMTLVYGITNLQDVQPGHYIGQVAFVLSPISSTRPQVLKTVDVYVTISEKESKKPTIEFKTASGSQNIILNARRQDSKSVDVVATMKGKFRGMFNIVQSLAGQLESPDGAKLDYGAVNFTVRQVSRGTTNFSQPTPFSLGQQNIYSSSPSGEADTSFVITYNIADLTNKKAGRYRTNIQYSLDGSGARLALNNLTLEVENERVFDLLVSPVDQRYAIEFYSVKAGEPPKISEVLVEINSNAGKQYQVSQEVYSELVNPEGLTIPAQYFTLSTQGQDIKGSLKITDSQEVKKGNTVLYVSNVNGDPDKFKIAYKLESPPDLKAGDYSTKITYTLLEI